MSKVELALKTNLIRIIHEICTREDGMTAKIKRDKDGNEKPKIPIFSRADRMNNIILIVEKDLFPNDPTDNVRPIVRDFADKVLNAYEKGGEERDAKVSKLVDSLFKDEISEPENKLEEFKQDYPRDLTLYEFYKTLGVSESVAERLDALKFNSPESIATADVKDLKQIKGLGQKTAEDLIKKASELIK